MPAQLQPRKHSRPLSPAPSVPRRKRGRTLGERLRFESFLLELSAAFARVTADAVDHQVNTWLGKLAKFIDVDRCTVWELAANGVEVRLLHLYSRPGLSPPPINAVAQDMAWLTDQYRRGNIVAWSRVPEDIPEAAAGERAWAHGLGARSVLCIPIAAGALTRSIVFAAVREQRKWPAPLIERLRLVGEIFNSAITRQRAEVSLQSSEARNRAILQALPDTMFVMSPAGVYLDHYSGTGVDLFVPRERFLGRRVEDILPPQLATRFRAAFAHVSKTGEPVEIQYPLPIDGEHRTFEARMVRRDDGAIVSIVRNVTERATAHAEIERLRAELVHFGRVSLMGQLTASLAHELMQPISAAISNAEACEQLLAQRVDRKQIRAILADVVSSCLRAADVVGRVRGLLRKERKPHQMLDLNRLVQDVGAVMRSDLIRRQVHLVMHLDPALPEIRADAIELQQVILNLLLNGAEALSQREPAERELTIATTQRAGTIELTVRDCGPGADPAHLQRMFEPFFTTKREGMGMGLTICAEIVRAHGGRLWAENGAGRGLTVHCLLPSAGPALAAPA